jgi:hypothetical protein
MSPEHDLVYHSVISFNVRDPSTLLATAIVLEVIDPETTCLTMRIPVEHNRTRAHVQLLLSTNYTPLTYKFTASLDVLDADDVEQSSSLPPVHPDYIQRGADVLALFQDMPRYRRFTQRWFDLSESSIVLQPVFRIWQDEMWNVHKDVLTAARPDELYALSEMVWRNTRQPLELNGQMTYSDWAHAATGVNLRWEVIGMILSLVGLVAVNLSDWDSIFDDIRDDIVDRSTFSERMRNASELVLCFCYECEVLNDLYICFIYEGLCLIELLKGDSRKYRPTDYVD